MFFRLLDKILHRPPLLAVRFDHRPPTPVKSSNINPSTPAKSSNTAPIAPVNKKTPPSSNYTTDHKKSQPPSSTPVKPSVINTSIKSPELARSTPVKPTLTHPTSPINPAQPPTLVFLHGIAASSSTWLPHLRELARDPSFAHCRLIALDLLGFGHSSRNRNLRYTYDEYSATLDRTLKSLRVTTPIILVGHSMGALIAADFTLRHPPLSSHHHATTPQYSTTLIPCTRTSQRSSAPSVSHLLLVSPPVILPSLIARTPDKFYLETYANLQQLATLPGGQVLANFADITTSFEAKYLHTPAFQCAMKNIVLNKDNYANIIHLRTPTVIIHGRFDPLVYKPNLVKITKHNPDIKLVTTTSHHDIDPAKFTKIRKTLLEFLSTS